MVKGSPIAIQLPVVEESVEVVSKDLQKKILQPRKLVMSFLVHRFCYSSKESVLEESWKGSLVDFSIILREFGCSEVEGALLVLHHGSL